MQINLSQTELSELVRSAGGDIDGGEQASEGHPETPATFSFTEHQLTAFLQAAVAKLAGDSAAANATAAADGQTMRSAAELLVRAYALGEARGGSTDWDDLGLAYEAACNELGPEAVAEIESRMEAVVAAEDGEGEDEAEEGSESDD